VPGEVLAFPVEQTCGAQVASWTEVAAPGADAKGAALKSPAPLVRIVAKPAAADTVRMGDLTLTAPWLRATPGGAKVAGGYVRITNGGAQPDRLVAASMPLADHGEVHEMSMDGGVMKMRPVDGGLTIPPGGSVELRPGGFHLMFMGLTGALKEGETVSGTLTFERAGTVPVTFRVGGFGAQGAPAGGHEHQH
jgi:periplasmic copper chaperone A